MSQYENERLFSFSKVNKNYNNGKHTLLGELQNIRILQQEERLKPRE